MIKWYWLMVLSFAFLCVFGWGMNYTYNNGYTKGARDTEICYTKPQTKIYSGVFDLGVPNPTDVIDIPDGFDVDRISLDVIPNYKYRIDENRNLIIELDGMKYLATIEDYPEY